MYVWNDVEGVERSLNSFNCYSCYSSRKSRKWCLQLLCNTAYKVTQFVTHVKRVKSILCIQSPFAPARIEGYCVSLLSWGFRCSPLVRGGSFVNFLGLVKLQGWLQARHTANPQFLKLKGAQQPSNSYISTTKLHPPYPNQDCLPV